MIPKNRTIITELKIVQSDGFLMNVSDYLVDASISCGSLTTAGDTGADGIARTLTFTLKNDIDNNFSPLSRKGVVKYATQVLTGTGGNTYSLSNTNAIEESIRVRTGTGYANYTGTFTVNGTTLTTSQLIPNGDQVRIGYSYIDKTADNIWNLRYNFGTGYEYSPLIFENRFVRMKALIGEPIYQTFTIYGTGATEYVLGDPNVIRNSIRIKNAYNGKTWDSMTTWDNETTWDAIGTVTDWYTQAITYNYYTNTVNFEYAIPNGVVCVIQYSTILETAKTIFEGYISEYTCTNNQITVTAKDLAKLLQDRFILSNEIRAYTTAYTDNIYYVTDPVTSTVYENGIPLETFIQNCLDDLGLDLILYTPVSPLYTVLPKVEQWEYKTAWDLVQQFANNIGWSVTAKYYSPLDEFRLTLIEVPRTKSTADYALTADDDIYVEELTVSGNSIRNSVVVGYIDSNDNNIKKYCTAQEDSTSISVYGKRPVIIEEENTNGIDTNAEAVAMAQAILADCKDLQANVSIEMPFFPDLDLFSTVSVDNYKLSSTLDLVGVQSVQHTISAQNKQFRTSIMGCQKVIGGRQKWRNLQTRKDKFRQVTTKVADSIFAQIRDNTLHIKNQVQFDFWVQSLPKVYPTADLTTTYNRVIIYAGNYSMNYETRYIKMKKIWIDGKGDVTVNNTRQFTSDGEAVFRIISDSFRWDNIDVTLTNSTSNAGILFDLAPYSTTDYTNYKIGNSCFVSDLTINRIIRYQGDKANTNLAFHDNRTENFVVYYSSLAGYSKMSKLLIIDNEIKSGLVLYASKVIDSVEIVQNKVIDALIIFSMRYFAAPKGFDNILIVNNDFNFSDYSVSGGACVYFNFTYTIGANVINNLILSQNRITAESTTSTTNTAFLKLDATSASGLNINNLNMMGNVAWMSSGSFITDWIKDLYSSYIINQQKPAVLDNYNSKF